MWAIYHKWYEAARTQVHSILRLGNKPGGSARAYKRATGAISSTTQCTRGHFPGISDSSLVQGQKMLLRTHLSRIHSRFRFGQLRLCHLHNIPRRRKTISHHLHVNLQHHSSLQRLWFLERRVFRGLNTVLQLLEAILGLLYAWLVPAYCEVSFLELEIQRIHAKV
jgi:hypothetical protein